jgi:pSer/pThr/pTyr-binding forkhead associated (FHA) protein
MPEIVVRYEDKVIERLVTQKKIINIGRSSDNDIILDNKAVSRKHAQIEFGDDSALIIDNESLNGTFVNKRKISEEILKDKDQITIGKFDLVYHQNAPKDLKLSDLDGTRILHTKKQKELLQKDEKSKEIIAKAGCSVLLGVQNTKVNQFYLDKPVITLGKSKYVNIKAQGLWVSKIQAKIIKEKDSHVLVNLGRKGKTKVNGDEVQRHPLRNDDLLEVGKSVFRFIQGKNK